MSAKQLRDFGASLSGKQDQINELIDRHSLMLDAKVTHQAALHMSPLLLPTAGDGSSHVGQLRGL
jgi:hypothetical protein